jgi:hypothetical protein
MMKYQTRKGLAAFGAGLLLLACLVCFGCGGPSGAGTGQPAHAASAAKAVKYEDLSISGTQDAAQAVPVSPGGLTVVNLFDEFCAECAGGQRLRTLARIQQAAPRAAVLTLFSSEKFTEQDVENFKLLLDPKTEGLLRGSTQKVQASMVKQQLLVVLNTRKEVVWQEAPGMSEEELFTAVKRVIESGGA